MSKSIGWMHSNIEAGDWTEKHVKQKMFPKHNANSPFLLLHMGLFFNAHDSTTSILQNNLALRCLTELRTVIDI